MKFGYTIVYVPDVLASVVFYERAFGLTRRFVHESSMYAEMETGETALAFAANEEAEANNLAIRPNLSTDQPAGFELCFVTKDVAAAFHRACEVGATPVVSPTNKPWGQTVAYVRDLHGCLVELATPIG